MEISQAYEVLSDDEKRSNYDRFGEEGVNGNPGGGPGGGGHGGFDPFQHMFGQQRRQQQQRQRGPNTESTLEISLKDAYNGRSIPLKFNMMASCNQCKGSGSADGKFVNCNQCHGKGIVIMEVQLAPGMVQRIQQTCPKCQGQRHLIANPCKKCHGAKVVREGKTLVLDVEPGVPREFEHVFHGEADKQPGLEQGDLVMKLRESKKDNWGYRRRGQNLFRTEMLTEEEALKGGWSRDIPCLDGETTIRLARKRGQKVMPGEVEVLAGHGMPILESDDEHGDLYVEYVVVFKGKADKDEL